VCICVCVLVVRSREKEKIFIFIIQEFRLKAHLARHLATAHGLAIRAGSPRPVMKTRAAFCLITTPLTRISRQVCADVLKIRRAARQPLQPINIALIKQECEYLILSFIDMRLLRS